ncbi:MAG TPA: acyl-CoA dehydrogenase family protein [Streptosporangiaceae bacterium]|nr:acyl-CoA dehydrogenase family protein [Streptosporangiaceae bacterium]
MTAEDEEFRSQIRGWLEQNLSSEFAALRGLGGPGREHEQFEQRLAWNRHLAASGWTCIGWPAQYGGRDATLAQQVIFHEEYARSGAPARVGHMGEELLGPTVIAFGTPEQKERFLPPIAAVTELWCQGYSEPGAGSDLASVSTSAVPDGSDWVITGQKVWTSLATVADWCFLLARTEPGSRRSAGLSYLLVPMKQPGITVRPIRQLTGTSEFNEVFFDGARTPREMVVGTPGDGWRIAMATLAIERGVSTLGQQVGYQRELDALIAEARRTGAAANPLLRDRLARAWIGLQVMREQVVAMLDDADETGTGSAASAASVVKLLWSRWHRDLGELAMEVRGPASMLAESQPHELDDWQRLYLFSRADTIYGGSQEIQLGIIAERALGLPRQPRP